MAYCTITDIQNRAGGEAALRAFDRDGDGTVDTAAITAAIAWADAIIDAKLAASHGTPFTEAVVVLVREISIDLALYRVTSGYTGATGSVKAPYRQGYDDAMALLKDLARDQTARLPSGAPDPVSRAQASVPTATSSPSFWGNPNDPDSWSGF